MDDLVKQLRECSSDEAMWSRQAADRIEQLEDRANAATAAAYEVAARRVEREGHSLGDEIRALATPDQTAALDKLIAEAVKPWADMAQECIALTQHPETTWDLPARLVRRMNDAILALIGEKK